MLAHGGEQLGLLDGVYAEVGFHVEVQLQHILGVAGLFGDHPEDLFLYGILVHAGGRGLGRRGRRCGRRGGPGRGGRHHGFGPGRGHGDRGCKFFHRGGGPDAGCLFILYPEGVENRFQFWRLVSRDLFQPGLVAGGVLEAAFPRLPDAFQQRHRHVRAEAGGEAQGVLEVVLAALGKVDAGQFGVRYLVVGDGRDQARIQRPHGDRVLERGAHRVAGKAFHVAHDDLVGRSAESAAQGLHLGGGAAAAGRGVGLVGHEHHVRRHFLFLKTVDALRLGHELLHHRGDVFGVEAGHVVGRVGAFGEQQAGERLHAAREGEGLVLYHHADGGRAGDEAVAPEVERQGSLGDVLLGGGGAGGEEAGHGPALHGAVGDVVGRDDHDALALAGADPGFGHVHGLGGGGAGGADVYGGPLGAHPLRELAVGYRDDFQQEVRAEGVRVFCGVIVGQLRLQPAPEFGFVAFVRQFVHYLVVKLPELGGVEVGVLVVEIAGGFLDELLGGREGRREDHAGL